MRDMLHILKNLGLRASSAVFLKGLGLLASSLAFVGCSTPASIPDAAQWKQDGFLMSTFCFGSSDAAIRLAKEAGLDLLEFAFSYGSTASLHQGLTVCDMIGMKSMAYDNRLLTGGGDAANPVSEEELIRNAVREYSSHSSVMAYYLWDEVDTPNNEKVRKMTDQVRRQDPARLAFSCLFPSYGMYNWSNSPINWENSAYAVYVDDYLKTVNPDVLCFDYYPFHQKQSTVITNDWYRDMGLYRTKAAQYNKPFWYYYQSVDLGGPTNDLAVNITEGQIRVGMYTGLAYGAKTLSSYIAVNYMWDREGNKQPRFEEGKALIREVKTTGNYLFDKTTKKIYHTGLPAGNYNAIYYLDDFASSDLLASAPDNLIISVFEDGKTATKYLLAVNKDWGNVQTGHITLKSAKNIGKLNTGNGNVEPVSTSSLTIPLNLEMGGGALYVIK